MQLISFIIFSFLYALPFIILKTSNVTWLQCNFRASLYQAFGHLISDAPLAAIVTEAKKVHLKLDLSEVTFLAFGH